MEPTFNKDGNCARPNPIQMFKIGDKVVIDMSLPKHSYYNGLYNSPSSIYTVTNFKKDQDGGWLIQLDKSIIGIQSSDFIYQDRFMFACRDIFKNDDFLL